MNTRFTQLTLVALLTMTSTLYADVSYAITRGNLEFVIGNKVKDKMLLT